MGVFMKSILLITSVVFSSIAFAGTICQNNEDCGNFCCNTITGFCENYICLQDGTNKKDAAAWIETLNQSGDKSETCVLSNSKATVNQ